MRVLSLAGVVAMTLSMTAHATTYSAYSSLSFTQNSFTETPDSSTGYIDADTNLSVTNTGTTAQVLYYIALGLSLNGVNAPWSSSLGEFTTGTYTAQPISSIVLAAYSDVSIAEPTAAGYTPGGTIPLYTVGLVNPGQTLTFDVVRKSNAIGFATNVGFVAAVSEPASLALLALPVGLAGLIVAGRRRKCGEVSRGAEEVQLTGGSWDATLPP